MITVNSTARALARKRVGKMSAAKLEEVIEAVLEHWRSGLADGDEVDLVGIGRIHPLRWTLSAQHSLYRTRVGRTPLNRKYTYTLRIEGDVDLKAAIRKTFM